MTNNKIEEQTIVWFSRHPATEKQREELREKGFTNIIRVNATAESGSDAWEKCVAAVDGKTPDAIMAVLPIPLLSELLRVAGDTPVIRAVMNRTVHEDGSATFTHDHFERVLKVKVVTEPF